VGRTVNTSRSESMGENEVDPAPTVRTRNLWLGNHLYWTFRHDLSGLYSVIWLATWAVFSPKFFSKMTPS